MKICNGALFTTQEFFIPTSYIIYFHALKG